MPKKITTKKRKKAEALVNGEKLAEDLFHALTTSIEQFTKHPQSDQFILDVFRDWNHHAWYINEFMFQNQTCADFLETLLFSYTAQKEKRWLQVPENIRNAWSNDMLHPIVYAAIRENLANGCYEGLESFFAPLTQQEDNMLTDLHTSGKLLMLLGPQFPNDFVPSKYNMYPRKAGAFSRHFLRANYYESIPATCFQLLYDYLCRGEFSDGKSISFLYSLSYIDLHATDDQLRILFQKTINLEEGKHEELGDNLQTMCKWPRLRPMIFEALPRIVNNIPVNMFTISMWIDLFPLLDLKPYESHLTGKVFPFVLERIKHPQQEIDQKVGKDAITWIATAAMHSQFLSDFMFSAAEKEEDLYKKKVVLFALDVGRHNPARKEQTQALLDEMIGLSEENHVLCPGLATLLELGAENKQFSSAFITFSTFEKIAKWNVYASLFWPFIKKTPNILFGLSSITRRLVRAVAASPFVLNLNPLFNPDLETILSVAEWGYAISYPFEFSRDDFFRRPLTSQEEIVTTLLVHKKLKEDQTGVNFGYIPKHVVEKIVTYVGHPILDPVEFFSPFLNDSSMEVALQLISSPELMRGLLLMHVVKPIDKHIINFFTKQLEKKVVE